MSTITAVAAPGDHDPMFSLGGEALRTMAEAGNAGAAAELERRRQKRIAAGKPDLMDPARIAKREAWKAMTDEEKKAELARRSAVSAARKAEAKANRAKHPKANRPKANKAAAAPSPAAKRKPAQRRTRVMGSGPVARKS